MALASRIRGVVLGSLVVAGAGLGTLVAAGIAAPASDLPDLTALLPAERPGSRNARWVDTVEIPGRTLFRFDSVILNEGSGALEVYRDPAGTTFQRTWSGGAPAAAGTSKTFPAGTSSGDRPITLGGAGQPNALRYSAAVGHEHFHSQKIAAYELRTTGGARVRPSAKTLAGFCLYDSWGDGTRAQYYPPDGTSCARGEANYTGLLRMGISPGWGDLYASQVWDQWVDVTGLTPGKYRLVGVVDPDDLYQESNEGNNTSAPAAVVVPGVIATPRKVSTPPGRAVDIPLAGEVVGRYVKSRRTKECNTEQASCMTTAAAKPASYAVAAPRTGTAALAGARVRYTPPPGFRGTATFSYTATDSRGLTSAPARVTVDVSSTGGAVETTRARPRSVGLTVATLRTRGPLARLPAAGVLRPPAGVSVCAGTVRIRTIAGRTAVRTVTAKVKRQEGACRYRVVFAVPKSKIGPTKALKVTARYLGSSRLLPRKSPVRTVRFS
ncbi:MAG: lysyl oxidase family protein [Thermoleophilia bacterium]